MSQQQEECMIIPKIPSESRMKEYMCTTICIICESRYPHLGPNPDGLAGF